MVLGSKERALEKLAYRYYLKDQTRSSEENWKMAIILLNKLKRRQLKNAFKKSIGNTNFPVVVSICLILTITVILMMG